MEPIAFVLGVFLLALAFWDLFETVVVPRPTPGWFRIARYLVRGSWRAIRTTRAGQPGPASDTILGLFPLPATGLVARVVGYGRILWAIRDQLQPVPADLGTAIYFAATSLLTIGYGDVVASGTLARIVAT